LTIKGGMLMKDRTKTIGTLLAVMMFTIIALPMASGQTVGVDIVILDEDIELNQGQSIDVAYKVVNNDTSGTSVTITYLAADGLTVDLNDREQFYIDAYETLYFNLTLTADDDAELTNLSIQLFAATGRGYGDEQTWEATVRAGTWLELHTTATAPPLAEEVANGEPASVDLTLHNMLGLRVYTVKFTEVLANPDDWRETEDYPALYYKLNIADEWTKAASPAAHQISFPAIGTQSAYLRFEYSSTLATNVSTLRQTSFDLRYRLNGSGVDTEWVSSTPYSHFAKTGSPSISIDIVPFGASGLDLLAGETGYLNFRVENGASNSTYDYTLELSTTITGSITAKLQSWDGAEWTDVEDLLTADLQPGETGDVYRIAVTAGEDAVKGDNLAATVTVAINNKNSVTDSYEVGGAEADAYASVEVESSYTIAIIAIAAVLIVIIISFAVVATRRKNGTEYEGKIKE